MVFATPTQAQVKQAIVSAVQDGSLVVSSAAGGTLSHASLSDDWKANAETAYTAMLEEMKLIGNDAIPFFVQTDLHGRSNDPARWLNNIDARIKNINLGDDVENWFSDSAGESYRTAALPIQNLITVYGNHEAHTGDAENATEYGLNYYYTDTTTAGRRQPSRRGYFVSYDNVYNVKYVVVCPYYMADDGSRDVAEILSDQMTWLLHELSADDGYDIILLMHQLWTDTYYHRDGTLQDWTDAPTVLENLWTVLKDRRNRRSGTITDSSGVEHSYDFSGTKSRILCSLHGHAHEELMLTEESMTAYVADWYGDDNCCVFGIIDRVNSKLKIWEVKTAGVQDALELDI